MLRRLKSLQEQCCLRTSVPERPFCNIGQTLQQVQTTAPGSSDNLQRNFDDAMPCVSTPKQPGGSTLPSNCADVAGGDNRDLTASASEKLAKRSHSEVDMLSGGDFVP